MQEIKDNILNFFKGLKFIEKEHKYFYNSKAISISVSGLIKKYYTPFDENAVSLKLSKINGLSQKEILMSWKNEAQRGIDKGNKAHLFGELYPFNRDLKPTDLYEVAIVNFWNDLPSHIIPVTMELRMFHKKYLFAGTADILLYNTITKTFIIGDYKTNKDLFKNFKSKTLLKPFSNMLENSFNKYQLQLSYYQLLFEQTGLKVSSRKLIWLLPDGTYKLYDTEDYTKVLNHELEIGTLQYINC